MDAELLAVTPWALTRSFHIDGIRNTPVLIEK
jgi:hypothetical protein